MPVPNSHLQRPAWISLSDKLGQQELVSKLNSRLGQLFTTVANLVADFNTRFSVVEVTGNYTARSTDRLLRVTAAGVTITLPPAVDVPGQMLFIKKIGGGAAVTVDANGAETIDGALTANLPGAYSTISLVSNGVGWDILI